MKCIDYKMRSFSYIYLFSSSHHGRRLTCFHEQRKPSTRQLKVSVWSLEINKSFVIIVSLLQLRSRGFRTLKPKEKRTNKANIQLSHTHARDFLLKSVQINSVVYVCNIMCYCKAAYKTVDASETKEREGWLSRKKWKLRNCSEGEMGLRWEEMTRESSIFQYLLKSWLSW